MIRLLAPAFALLLSLCAYTAFAQSADVVTDTVAIPIDGVTRTLTVTFTTTGVVSVDVVPISNTFKVTATRWLESLQVIMERVHPGNNISPKWMHDQLDRLSAATETPYPSHYAPFVRRYQFAIHACRNLLSFYENAMADKIDLSTLITISPYFVLMTSCYEQYQDAYVEMERIAHPTP